MFFIPIGVGDAFSRRYYSSSVYISHNGYAILVDCPHPVRKILADAESTSGHPMDLDNIDAIVLTHLHADHASGLEGCAFFNRYVRQKRTRLYLFEDSARVLWPQYLAANLAPLCDPVDKQRHMEDFFDIVALNESRRVFVGPFTIECRITRHHVPTTALRISNGHHTLALSADTSHDPDLIDWLCEADVVIHETNRGPHTPYAALAALPAPIRQKMRLIHYPDDFDVTQSLIEPLEQGRLYTMSSMNSN